MPLSVTVWVIVYGAAWLVVAGLLAVMCAIDVRERRIPNELVASVCAIWVLLQAALLLFSASAGVPLAEAARTYGVPHLFLPLFTLPSPVVGLLTAAAAVIFLGGMSAVYERLFRKQAMGAGDVKLIGAFALFLGPVPTVVCLALACVLALAAALPARMRTFPFAPALALAFVCVMLVEL